jgi:hypothetical protein
VSVGVPNDASIGKELSILSQLSIR